MTAHPKLQLLRHQHYHIKPTPAISNSLESSLTLASQFIYLFVQDLDHVVRPVNRGSEFAAFSLPAADPIYLCATAPLFRIDLVAEFAFLTDRDGLHNQFHTASFTCAVLPVAMLSKMPPFPVAASKTVLVEKAHF